MKIAVVFGGISPERNVSISGGLAVIKALKSFGHEVVAIDPAYGKYCLRNIEDIEPKSGYPSKEELAEFPPRNLIDAVNSDAFDGVELAFLVLHGQYGEDGKIQALLDLRGIPYTGSNVKASSLAIDKISSKMIFMAAGIPTPEWIVITKDHIDNYDAYEEIREQLGNHIVIKPNDQGSTIGISIVKGGNLDDIGDAIKEAFKYSDKVLVEKFIEGRELTVGVIGDEALPVIEIAPQDGFYDYEHKYQKGMTEYICPADISHDIADFTMNSGYTAFRALGCSGFGRTDFRLDNDGMIYCLEVNTIPGFTETSLVPMAAAEVEIEFPELCERIINIALNIEQEEDE